MSHIVTRFGHGESVAWVGGDLGSVLGPVGEGIARVGRGCQSAGSTLIVFAGTNHCAALAWVGGSCNVIGVGQNIDSLNVGSNHGIVG